MPSTFVRAIIAILLAAFALPMAAVASADAAPVSCDAGPSWTVSNEVELNQAIGCYNLAAAAGHYTITFDSDIPGTATYESAGEKHVTQVITQSGAGFSLAIDGAGHALTNSFVDTGFDHSLFVVRGTASVTFANMTMGPSTEIGLIVDGGTVRVSNTWVFDNFYGIDMRGGTLHVENSLVDDSIYGIEVTGGKTVIANSEIRSHALHGVFVQGADTNVDIVSSTFNSNEGNAVRVVDGSVGINNSTLISNGFGGFDLANVHAEGGFVSISNSTLPGRFFGPAASTYGLGHIAMSSSIADECRGFVVNLGWNTGGCFGGPEVEFGAFGDNGCVTPMVDGCVRTFELLEGSPAIGQGQCEDTVRYDLEADEYGRGQLLTDQRGEPRKAACDSGSYETEQQPMCNGMLVTLFVESGVPLVGTASGDVILGTPGDDIIDGAGGDDIICGDMGADLIIGGDGNDALFGQGGADIIRGNTGEDLIEGGDGNDRLQGGTGDDELLGGEGDDFIGGFGGADFIQGDAGDDLIFGGFGADTIEGGDGNDTMRGLIGDDFLKGEAGDDQIFGDRGNDEIWGGDGHDVIHGGNADDIILGGNGDDELHGGKADDWLAGESGTDLCVGNAQRIQDIATDCETVFGVP